MRPWLGLLLGVGACAPDARVGLVLLDGAAAERGAALRIDGRWTASVLPVALDGEVRVASPDGGATTVDVRPGEVVMIGLDGDVPWVDRQALAGIDRDQVSVEGTVDALASLAEDLADDVDVETEDETAWLSGPDALFRLADADEVDGLTAVWLMQDEAAARVVDVSPPGASGCGLSPDVAVIGGREAGWAAALSAWLGAWVPDPSADADVVEVDPSLVAFVGYYRLHAQELALSLDGAVREAEGERAPIGAWALGPDGQPQIRLGDGRVGRPVRVHGEAP